MLSNGMPGRLLALVGLICMSPCALAVGTAVGTPITNTASVTYDVGGSTVTATSNATSVTVAQILNVSAVVQTPSVPVAPGDANRAISYLVTNTGNGADSLVLTPLSTIATGDQFDPVLSTPVAIYLDSDGTPGFSPGDTAYVPGSPVALPADGSVTVLVLNNMPGGLNSGDTGISQLTAARSGGVGAPGTVFAGGGVGGVDAVVGLSGAQATRSGTYIVSNIALSAVKSQTVTDQFGGNRPVPGATITYTVVITPTGTGTAGTALFADVIPANTTYSAGSLRLNGVLQTDITGDDAGGFESTPAPRVVMSLGNLTQASGPQTIQFSATIN
jgi:uncharacterized repeat protein (TIGR01451 family)